MADPDRASTGLNMAAQKGRHKGRDIVGDSAAMQWTQPSSAP